MKNMQMDFLIRKNDSCFNVNFLPSQMNMKYVRTRIFQPFQVQNWNPSLKSFDNVIN